MILMRGNKCGLLVVKTEWKYLFSLKKNGSYKNKSKILPI